MTLAPAGIPIDCLANHKTFERIDPIKRQTSNDHRDADLNRAFDRRAQSAMLYGATLAIFALSLLLVGGAWWKDWSARRLPTAPSAALANDWERAALTLRLEPSPALIERSTRAKPNHSRYVIEVESSRESHTIQKMEFSKVSYGGFYLDVQPMR